LKSKPRRGKVDPSRIAAPNLESPMHTSSATSLAALHSASPLPSRPAGPTGGLPVLLSRLTLATALVLLAVPFAPLAVSAVLATVGVGIPLVRWVRGLVAFECNFEDLRLTEDEVSEGLDW